MEESFVNKESFEAKNELFNPIINLPKLSKEENKNSWRLPKRKLKTVIRYRAPGLKENKQDPFKSDNRS